MLPFSPMTLIFLWLSNITKHKALSFKSLVQQLFYCDLWSIDPRGNKNERLKFIITLQRWQRHYRPSPVEGQCFGRGRSVPVGSPQPGSMERGQAVLTNQKSRMCFSLCCGSNLYALCVFQMEAPFLRAVFTDQTTSLWPCRSALSSKTCQWTSAWICAQRG